MKRTQRGFIDSGPGGLIGFLICCILVPIVGFSIVAAEGGGGKIGTYGTEPKPPPAATAPQTRDASALDTTEDAS